MNTIVGACLAFASAACFAMSYAGQFHAIADADRLELRRPMWSAGRLLRNRSWLISYGVSGVGWGAYVAALHFAELSAVQAISAGAIGAIAIVAGSGRGVPRRARGYVGLATGGIVLVLVSLRSSPPSTHPGAGAIGIVVGAGIALAIVLVVLVPESGKGAALGVASGLAYGVGDVATKAAVGGAPTLIPVFVVCASIGFVSLQLAYQRASLLASAGLSCLLTNAIPIVAGAVLFGEIPTNGSDAWLRGVGSVAAVIGAVCLAREPVADRAPTSVESPRARAGG
jgi:hypothetical protein